MDTDLEGGAMTVDDLIDALYGYSELGFGSRTVSVEDKDWFGDTYLKEVGGVEFSTGDPEKLVVW